MRKFLYMALISKEYRYSLINLLASILICAFYIQTVQASQSKSISVKLDLDKSVPVDVKKYGVNGALLGTRTGYASEDLVDIFSQIGIKFSRFPGGTIGNYYDWKTGAFSCYRTPVKSSASKINRMNRALLNKKVPYRVDDYFSFVDKTSSEFTYVLNVLCGSPGSNGELITHMKKNHVDLRYIEMANEVYSKSYAWGYKDAKSYLGSIKENIPVIKKYYPQAKIGLIVSPKSFSAKQLPDKGGRPNSSWPERSRNFDAISSSSDLADGLVIHLYGHLYTDKFAFIQADNHQALYNDALKKFNSKFQISIDYLKSLGQGKPVWITEWGVTAPPKKRHYEFKKYKKSAYQALLMASVLTLITLEPGIEIANYHNITDFWTKIDNGFEISPLGRVLKLFIDMTDNYRHAYKANFYHSDRGAGAKSIKGIYYTSTEADALLLVNEGSQSYMIDDIKTVFKTAKVYSVNGMFIDNNEFRYINNEKVAINDKNKNALEIKPFSILRINLEK